MKIYICEITRKGEQVSVYHVKANNLTEAKRFAQGSKEKKGRLTVKLQK